MKLTDRQRKALFFWENNPQAHYKEVAKALWKKKLKNPKESVRQLRIALEKKGLVRVERLPSRSAVRVLKTGGKFLDKNVL